MRFFHRLRDSRLYLPNPTFANPAWIDAGCHVLIVRLSPFADVERSTPHLFLAREVRSALPDAFIDMAFLPSPGDARIIEGAGLPLVTGTQSRRGLADFDILLVSNSWLLEQVNLPFLLAHSGFPLWAGARAEELPPLILGGSNASAAHALVSETGDCMADAIFFGEGEGRVGRIVRRYRELASLPKRERLTRIAGEVPGLWPAGSLSAIVRKASCADDVDAPGAGTSVDSAPAPILPGNESATARLPITHGCPCLCSFCFEGHDRRPFREIASAVILENARELKRNTGADTLEIESFNFNTHTGIGTILLGLNRIFHRVNLMSQRVDILARTPGLLDLEIAADKRSFTLGIEGISEKTRSFLHKSLSEGDIRSVLKEIHARRTREVKLFYILTGREKAKDFTEFAEFAAWLRQLRLRAEAAPRVLFSFGLLVRMPFTPLRHDPPLLEEEAWRQGIGRVKSICETNGFEFRLALRWSEYAATQALALGGHSLHDLLTQCADAGCITGPGLPEQAGIAVGQWIATHAGELSGEKPLGHPFPFPFLDDEETRSFLHRQYTDARAGRDTGYCRSSAEGTEECGECPGCTRVPRRSAGRSAALRQQTRELAHLMQSKHHLKPLSVMARLPREAAGMGARWGEAWLMRALFRLDPAQLDNVLAIGESLVEASGVFGEETAWFGKTVVALTAWDTGVLVPLLQNSQGIFGPLLPGYEPGVFRTLRVRLDLPAETFGDAPGRLAAFLRDNYAPVTLTGSGGAQRLHAAGKAAKKKMLLEGELTTSPAGTRAELLIGPKMELGAWLQSFGERGAPRQAIAEITAIE
jgi:radical SAM superfamily enzyme YgiQ (UPF0313 family)